MDSDAELDHNTDESLVLFEHFFRLFLALLRVHRCEYSLVNRVYGLDELLNLGDDRLRLLDWLCVRIEIFFLLGGRFWLWYWYRRRLFLDLACLLLCHLDSPSVHLLRDDGPDQQLQLRFHAFLPHELFFGHVLETFDAASVDVNGAGEELDPVTMDDLSIFVQTLVPSQVEVLEDTLKIQADDHAVVGS